MPVDKGTCSCGEPVERERATGRFAETVNSLPFACDACVERDQAEAERQQHEELEQERIRGAAQRIERCGLPLQLRRVELDQLDRSGCGEAIDAAGAWARDGGALLFTGPFGTGKTTIAAGALRRRLLAGGRAHWISAPLLMARLGSGLGSASREWALGVLTRSTAFVLDDLDKTRPTEYGAEQIFLAVDGAVTNGRPLIVTTNLSPSHLAARWPEPFGEAIVSRLVGYCDVITVNGADRRLRGVA